MFHKQQKMYDFNLHSGSRSSRRCGFTLVEVAASLLILSLLIGSTMVLMNRYLGAVMDLRLREHAFNLARSNMEILLTETRVSEKNEYGTSEQNPDIDWQTTIEPFYEPMTDRMWVRAICSAGYIDSQGRRQDVELEHWLTGLSASQVKQIVAQQEIEMEYLELLESDYESEIQAITRAYLEERDLDVNAYDRFVERQRREKIEYLSDNGMEGYDELLDELKEEENVFLDKLGMDFDDYNDFALTYEPEDETDEEVKTDTKKTPMYYGFPSSARGSNAGSTNKSNPATNSKPNRNTNTSSGFGGISEMSTPSPTNDIPWDRIPEDLWPIFSKLLGVDPPAK